MKKQKILNQLKTSKYPYSVDSIEFSTMSLLEIMEILNGYEDGYQYFGPDVFEINKIEILPSDIEGERPYIKMSGKNIELGFVEVWRTANVLQKTYDELVEKQVEFY